MLCARSEFGVLNLTAHSVHSERQTILSIALLDELMIMNSEMKSDMA